MLLNTYQELAKKQSADKTDKEKTIQDLEKARWYINRRIKEIEEGLCD